MSDAAATTYSLLIDALTQWRGGDSQPFTQYGGWIRNFEAWFNRRARTREMEAFAVLTLGGSRATLPGDYLSWRSVEWAGSTPARELKYVHPKRYNVGWTAIGDGHPTEFFTIENNFLYVTPPDTANNVIVLRYFQKLPPLQVSGNKTPQTRILLHFNGQDGSTSIVDDAAGGSQTWTAAGNAQIDTAEYVFGGASLLLDGTGDYVTTADSADLTYGANDFHVHARVKPAVDSTYMTIFGQGNSSVTAATSSILVSRNSANGIDCNISDGSTFTVITAAGTPVVTGGWYDIEVSRSGTSILIFINGQLQGQGTFSGAVNDSANAFRIGMPGEAVTDLWHGWIDEFMLAIGEAGHTANFTPDSRPFDARESNWLSLSHPDIYLAGSLYEGMKYLRDFEAMAVWKGTRDEIFGEIMGLSAQSQGEDAVREGEYF